MKKIRKTFYYFIWIVYPLLLLDMFRLTILRERHNGVVYDEKIMNGVKIFGWCIRNAASNPFVLALVISLGVICFIDILLLVLGIADAVALWKSDKSRKYTGCIRGWGAVFYFLMIAVSTRCLRHIYFGGGDIFTYYPGEWYGVAVLSGILLLALYTLACSAGNNQRVTGGTTGFLKIRLFCGILLVAAVLWFYVGWIKGSGQDDGYMLQYMFGGYKLTEYSIWSVILKYMLSLVFS